MARTNVNGIAKKLRYFNDYVRGELRRKHHSQEDLAIYLNVSQGIISMRLRGLSPWPLEDALETCEFLDVKLEEII